MKIFVTGGTGFNGRHLVKKMQEQDNEILVLTRNRDYTPSQNNVKALYGDLSFLNEINFKDRLMEFNPDVAIHLAWSGIPNDYSPLMSSRNLRNSLSLIELLAEIKCPKIISSGTCWEYGIENGEISEETMVNPIKPLAIAKNSLFKVANEIAKEQGIVFIWTRFFYPYGPGREDSTLIPYLANCALSDTKPQLKTPNNKYDFIYVEDVANALSMISHSCDYSSVYNIGSGQSIAIKEIAKLVYQKLNKEFNEKDFPIEIAKTADFWADISKIKKEIGWEPKINIKEGISKTVKTIKL